MSNYQRTAAWLAACGKEPGNRLHFSTQVGCHIEEVVELLTSIETTFTDEEVPEIAGALGILTLVADALKSGTRHAQVSKPLEFLDALADCEVTGNGLAFLAGMDKDGADQAVLDSNDSKFNEYGTPVILAGGKIGKSHLYIAPDLTPFLKAAQ
jgi:hypothetical protein